MKLTKKQQETLDKYYAEGDKLMRSTDPIDLDKAIESLKELYQAIEQPFPSDIRRVTNFDDGAAIVMELVDKKQPTSWEDLRPYKEQALGGSLDAYWLAYYKFLEDHIAGTNGVEKNKYVNIFYNIAKHCGPFWAGDTTIVLVDRPTVCKTVNGKLHSEEGPALAFTPSTNPLWSNYQHLCGVVTEENGETKEILGKSYMKIKLGMGA